MMRRVSVWWGVVFASMAAMPAVSAEEVVAASEESYAAAQAAFLQEDFARVIELVHPLVSELSAEELSTAHVPGDAAKLARLWLWDALSLARLQRSADALRELDRLKHCVSGLPLGTVAQQETRGMVPEALFWEGEISRNASKLIRAQLAYQQVLLNFPDSSWRAQAQMGLALSVFRQQNYELAAGYFHEVALASSGSPNSWEVKLLEGVCVLRLRQLHTARAIFQTLTAPFVPRTIRAQACFYLGETLTSLRAFTAANDAYKQAIECDGQSRWARLARFGLGWSYFQQHRCRESLALFSDYLAESATPTLEGGAAHSDTLQELPEPGRAERLFAQGRCTMELGDEPAALRAFDTLRADDPEHPLATDAALHMARIFERQQRFAEEQSVLEAVIRQAFNPDQVRQANLQLGLLMLSKGQSAQALEQLQFASESADVEVRQAALNGLGDAQLSLGQYDEALRWYEQAIRLSPTSRGSRYARYQQGRLKLQTGQTADAIHAFHTLLLEEAEQTSPAAASEAADRAATPLAPESRAFVIDTRLALAFAYLSTAQAESAALELDRLQSQTPSPAQRARADYYRALLAAQAGQEAEARQWCEQAIRRFPQSDEAFQARVLLADLVITHASADEAMTTLGRLFGSLEELPGGRRGALVRKLGDLAKHAAAYAQAIHWYELAWQDLPAQRSELDYLIASCYEEGTDLSAAFHRYQAITDAPWQVRGQLAAAKLMEREQRWQEAMRIYERVMRQAVPEAKIAQERRSSLERAVR